MCWDQRIKRIAKALVPALLTIAITRLAVGQIASPWPAADKLFHTNPRWLGADGAYSINLGYGRVLWMFGDTFVARKVGGTRRTAAFVHNSVAVQTGYDPAHASIKFYWRTADGHPSEIFPSEGTVWMWPTSGFRVGGALILFCDRVAPDASKDSLGFRLVGWTAYRVANPDDKPSAWELRPIVGDNSDVLLASSALQYGGYVYLLGVGNPKHDLYLARLALPAAARAEFSALEWWSDNGWERETLKRRPIISEGGTEASFQRDPRGTGFIEVNSVGFGASNVAIRRAPCLTGPWSEPQIIYRPPESEAPNAFVYAGKSHPELTGANLILTYVANGDDKRLATDMSIYFPRFVKVLLPISHNTKVRK